MSPVRVSFVIARALVGIGAWFAPDRTARFFGIKPERSTRFVTRLFAARELALAGALAASPGSSVAAVASVGVAVDTMDAIAGFDERRRGNLSTRATVLGPIGALGFATLGAIVARQAAGDEPRAQPPAA